MPAAPTRARPATAARDLLAAAMIGLAAAMLLSIIALRCIVVFTPQLYWATMPHAGEVEATEFGPAAAAITDLLAIAVLGLAITVRIIRNQSIAWWMLALWATGSSIAIYHATRDFESMRIGLDWIASLAIAIAAFHLAGDAMIRRILIAGAIAIAIPLAAETAFQVGVEHRMTVNDYQQRKAEIAAEHGWPSGSIEQRKFEERLFQLEATARFGFSNVLGSVAMTLTLLTTGVALAFIRSGRKPWFTPGSLAVIAVTAISAAIVVGSQSKGANLALLICLALLIALQWIPRRIWPWLGVAMVALAIGAVALRGYVGPPKTATGERSMLFRWHYWQAATRMWTAQPLLGVGPGRFQDQYLIYKNPLNPEEVSDPHNILIAYIATLGLGGVAWATLLLALLFHAGKSLTRLTLPATPIHPPTPESDSAKHWRFTIVLAALISAFALQYIAELPRYDINGALVWLLGTLGATSLACWLSGRPELDSPWAARGLFVAAIALLMHNQIEMALTNTMAAPLLLTILALAAAPSSTPAKPHPKWASALIPIAFLALLIVFFIFPVWPILLHESALDGAAKAARRGDIPTAKMWLRIATSSTFDPRITNFRIRLTLQMAAVAQQQGDTKSRDLLFSEAANGLQYRVTTHPDSPQLWRTLLMLRQFQFELTHDSAVLQQALDLTPRILALEPQGLAAHLMLADLAYDAGHPDQARPLYRRALEISDQSYLDPNKPLTGNDLQRARERSK